VCIDGAALRLVLAQTKPSQSASVASSSDATPVATTGEPGDQPGQALERRIGEWLPGPELEGDEQLALDTPAANLTPRQYFLGGGHAVTVPSPLTRALTAYERANVP
jgi:hypothetical protein